MQKIVHPCGLLKSSIARSIKSKLLKNQENAFVAIFQLQEVLRAKLLKNLEEDLS